MKSIDLRSKRIAILLVWTAGVFFIHLHMLNQSPEPCGLDGYYYAMEARSFMERNHLENPSLGPMFYVSGLMAKTTGDPILAVKLASSTFYALMIPLMFLFLRCFFSHGLSLAGAFLTAISPSLTAMSVNYLNNLFGLCCLIAFLGFFFSNNIKGPLKIVLCMATASGSILAHQTSLIFLLAIIVIHILDRYGVKKEHKPFIPVLIIIVFFLSSVLTLFITGQSERFTGVFSLKPSIPFLWGDFRNRTPQILWLAMSLSMGTSYAATLIYYRKTKSFYFTPLLVGLFYFPFWNLSSLDMGYRIYLSAAPAGIFSFIYLLSFLQIPMKKIPAAIVFLTLPLLLIPYKVYNPKHDPPYAYYREVIAPIDLQENSLLIAHQGLNHLYTYHKGFKDALNYIPDFPIAIERLWRVAYGASWRLLSSQFPEESQNGLIQELKDPYVLIREDLWQKYLDSEEPLIAGALENNWYNPGGTRPDFIRKSVQKSE